MNKEVGDMTVRIFRRVRLHVQHFLHGGCPHYKGPPVSHHTSPPHELHEWREINWYGKCGCFDD